MLQLSLCPFLISKNGKKFMYRLIYIACGFAFLSALIAVLPFAGIVFAFLGVFMLVALIG